MTKGAYTQELTPLALPDDYLVLDDGADMRYFEIERFRPQPAVDADTITVADNDDEKAELTNLEVWDGWLAQFRPIQLTESLPDDVTLRVDQGGKTARRYTTKDTAQAVDNGDFYQEVADDGDNERVISSLEYLYEQYVWEQEVPYFTLENTSGGQVNVDLTFSGFLFKLDPVNRQQVDGQPVHVPIERISGK